MPQLANAAPTCVHLPERLGDLVAGPIRLAALETWITAPARSEDGWAEIKPFLLVRLIASTGIEGWGEAFTLPCRELGVAAIIHALGHAARQLETLTPWAFRDMASRIADKHRGMDYAAATSAIEIALWDLLGKLSGRPLCEILGADRRKAIPVYANTWSATQPDTQTLAGRATMLVAQGFLAIKFYPLQNRSVPEAADCMAQLRAAVGDTINLMIDLASPNDPGLSRALAPLVTPFRPYWFEEPVDGEEIDVLRAIRQETGLRIVTGEKQCGLPHFRAVLAAGAADVLNPDIAGVGGILDMLEIAGLAQREGVAVSPHCWDSMTVAAAAMLHVCAAIPNADMAEFYPEYTPHGAGFASPGFVLDHGRAILADCPGLGVDVNATALAERATHYQKSDRT